MKKITLLFAFISAFTLTNCESTADAPESTVLNELTIKSGQSFGFCIGKCYNEIIIKGSEVELFVQERAIRGGQSSVDLKEYRYKEKLSAAEIETITKALNLSKISGLNDVYGCPDCADGGSEWLEVLQKGDVKDRVTFEYGNDVKDIESLTRLLRDKRQQLMEKYNKE